MSSQTHEYIIETMEIRYTVKAPNPQIAIRDFFRRVIEGKIDWRDTGLVGLVTGGEITEGNTVPFRTTPNYYNLGYITFERYSRRMHQEFPTITADQLKRMAERDKWMIEIIQPRSNPQTPYT